MSLSYFNIICLEFSSIDYPIYEKIDIATLHFVTNNWNKYLCKIYMNRNYQVISYNHFCIPFIPQSILLILHSFEYVLSHLTMQTYYTCTNKQCFNAYKLLLKFLISVSSFLFLQKPNICQHIVWSQPCATYGNRLHS